MQWPSKDKMREKLKVRSGEVPFPGTLVYKCDFSNHSQINVLDVSVELRIWFGQKGGEENAVKFTPILSPLDAGAHFVFYVVNDCPINAAVVMPDAVGIKIIGETMRRVVPLNRPNRSPIEPIMIFFPSNKQWVGEQPCQ